MTDEHTGTCIYDKGRFELRETDKAIIDLKGDFPPIMIASNTVDDGSEPNCADKGSVLHLLNELSDNNPNEERHWYLKKMLDKAWKQYHKQKEENEQLKETNQELYDFRLVLNALLFNEWAETGKYEVYKSKRHHDGEPCFDGEWFIVVAILPSGQVTNHYHIKHWDYFKIPSYERVKDEFDGHTSSVVLLRYGVLLE